MKVQNVKDTDMIIRIGINDQLLVKNNEDKIHFQL